MITASISPRSSPSAIRRLMTAERAGLRQSAESPSHSPDPELQATDGAGQSIRLRQLNLETHHMNELVPLILSDPGLYARFPELAIRTSLVHVPLSAGRLHSLLHHFFPARPAPSTTCVYLIGARRQGSHDERRSRSALDRCAPLKTLNVSRVSRRKKIVFKGAMT